MTGNKFTPSKATKVSFGQHFLSCRCSNHLGNCAVAATTHTHALLSLVFIAIRRNATFATMHGALHPTCPAPLHPIASSLPQFRCAESAFDCIAIVIGYRHGKAEGCSPNSA
jgi:hypothetical protein